MQSSVTWTRDMAFEADADGHRLLLDAAPEHGGQDTGPRPKPLVLTALSGCTAMDVISILRKMREEPASFAVEARSELTEEHPKVFAGITLVYRLEGDLAPSKVLKAVKLSLERYCGVTAMLLASTTIDHEIWLNGESLEG